MTKRLGKYALCHLNAVEAPFYKSFISKSFCHSDRGGILSIKYIQKPTYFSASTTANNSSISFTLSSYPNLEYDEIRFRKILRTISSFLQGS